MKQIEEMLKKPITVENLKSALEKSQSIDNQLKDAYFGLEQKIRYYEQKFDRVVNIVNDLEECQSYMLSVQKEYHQTRDSSLFSSDEYKAKKEEFVKSEQLLKEEGFFDLMEYNKLKEELREDKNKAAEYYKMIEQKDKEITLINQYLDNFAQTDGLMPMKGNVEKTFSHLAENKVDTTKVDEKKIMSQIEKLKKRYKIAIELKEKLEVVEKHLDRYEQAIDDLKHINKLCLDETGRIKPNVKESAYFDKKQKLQVVIDSSGKVLNSTGIKNRVDFEERRTVNARELKDIPKKVKMLKEQITNGVSNNKPEVNTNY